MDEIRFIDLFSGIGGFRRGLELSGGYRCVWSCDIDRSANLTYLRRCKPRKGTHYSGDVRRVQANNIPDHDVLCAGFPCQSFSISGNRKGFEDTRGTLFFEIARIADHKRPRILFLENVDGLRNHDDGKTFLIMLRILGELGYYVEWQVLYSKWFGIPQYRPRMFIVGHIGGEPTKTIFPIKETPSNGTSSYIQIDVSRKGYNSQQDRFYPEHSVMSTISAHAGGNTFNIITRNGVVRTLTPNELCRLQGFPDGWINGLSYTKKRTVIGNAVTVPIIQFLGNRIKESINSKSKRMET